MRSFQKIFAGLVCMAFVLIISAIPAKAATVTKELDYVTGSHTINRDINGDNKKDQITVNVAKNSYDMVNSIKVSVNGKSALTISKNSGSYYGASVYYIKMSKSKEFLQIIGLGDNDWRAVNAIYQYNKKTGKLKRVLELASGLSSAGNVVKATSKSIQIGHSYQTPETGWVNWKYTYTFKNGQFKLKSSTAAVKSSLTTYDNGDGYTKYFKKNKFKAMKSLTFYTSTSQKKKAFTAKKGNVLTLKKIKVSGKKVYMQFQLGKKTGWKKVDNDYSKVYSFNMNGMTGGWFYGVGVRLAG